MLNTTICHEDDSLRSYVAKFIEQYFKRNHIQYKISCCPSLHNLTTRFHPIDLLFTDIIFSDKTEMSTLLKIRKQHPSMMMVILTNNNEYAFWGGTQTRHKNRSKPVGQETTLPLRRWIQSLQMEGATGWNPCLRIPMQLPYTKPRKDFCRKESSR